MPKIIYSRWKNWYKCKTIVKNGPQIVKNEYFKTILCFWSFYVIISLHAKNCVCMLNGVACGPPQYKDEEGKKQQK